MKSLFLNVFVVYLATLPQSPVGHDKEVFPAQYLEPPWVYANPEGVGNSKARGYDDGDDDGDQLPVKVPDVGRREL